MAKSPIDLVGPFYTDEALSWSQQDTVNYIPVRAEVAGTWTPTKLVDAPGLRPWVWVGNYEAGTDSAPIRGLHDVEGRLFAVSGTTLYEISNAGVAIPIGSIPGVGRVSMAHNQVAGGHQLTVVNGTGGYVWNTATQSFQIITDEGFPGSSRVDFIDGYMMHVEPFGRFLLHSDLADALNFNTLDRFEAETQPDRTRSLIVNNQEVWAFGDRTIDVFANAGTAQGTFQNKGVSISVGCIAGASPAIIDNGVAWLGHDRVVYHARGYSPTRISTRAIDVALSECSLTDIRGAFSLVFEDRGHAIYYLTIPNGPTFGYDFSTGLWHRRASWHPERDIDGRWCLSALVRSNGQWVGGDYRTGKLYTLDWDYMLEGCEPLIRERVSPVVHNNGNRFTIDEVELQFETGGPETECVPFPYQPVGPQVSGEAPDGMEGDAYTFTYTVEAGTAPVVRTVLIDTTLPDGWEWDELTATISHDDVPVPVGPITLRMRVYDQNGLYDDHEDEFVILREQVLLVTGAYLGDDKFAKGDQLTPLGFAPIQSSSGADIDAQGTAAYGNGYWSVLNGASGVCRISDDNLATWASGTIPTPFAPTHHVYGNEEFVACGGIVVRSNWPPTDYELVTMGEADTVVALGFANGWYYYNTANNLWRTQDFVDRQLLHTSSGTQANFHYYFQWQYFDGYVYATRFQYSASVNRRHQLVRSESGLFDDVEIIVNGPQAGGELLYWMDVVQDQLVVYKNTGIILRSGDNFAVDHEIGIGVTVSSGPLMEGARKMTTNGQRLYFLGAGADQVAYSDDVGDTWTIVETGQDSTVSIVSRSD